MVLNGSLKLWISKKLQYNEEVAVVVNIARSIVFFKLGSGKGAGLIQQILGKLNKSP